MEIWSKCDICGRDIPVGELCYGLKNGNCICKDCCTGFENCTFTLAPAPTLTPPNEWVSVDEKLPEPGERVLATDCGFVGEFYINERGQWQRYNVNCHALLMALDILYWMPLPAPPGKGNNVPTNEPLTIEELREMNGEPVWIVDVGPHKWYGPGWAIVERENCLVRTVKNWNPVFFEKYGERWLAYRRPPEEKHE